MLDANTTPSDVDPTAIMEIFRGNFGTELLTAAVSHFGIFAELERTRPTFADLRGRVGLAERPFHVLLTALKAMGLVVTDGDRLVPTPLSRDYLSPGGRSDLSDYLGLAANSPGVLGMVASLRSNRPLGADQPADGAAFIYKEGIASAMEAEDSARRLTLALAGRARLVAPRMAAVYPLEGKQMLLDVGGGTGLYAIAWLLRHPDLKAIVWDRPEVLNVAAEMAEQHGVSDRLELRAGDMFRDTPPPGADVILLSNVLHDWDVPDCRDLLGRLSGTLVEGGLILIHDVFLSEALDGPLPIALYSASLFQLTEGRAYGVGEYRDWLKAAGCEPRPVRPTALHCGLLPGVKRGSGGTA